MKIKTFFKNVIPSKMQYQGRDYYLHSRESDRMKFTNQTPEQVCNRLRKVNVMCILVEVLREDLVSEKDDNGNEYKPSQHIYVHYPMNVK